MSDHAKASARIALKWAKTVRRRGYELGSSPVTGSFDPVAIAIRPERGESVLSRHHPVGVSTGYMEGLRSDWPAQVAEAAAASVFAVELSALSEKQLQPLQEFLASGPSLPFRYLSVHGPSKDRQMDEDKLVAGLNELVEWADVIVMHPDTIEEPGRYRALSRKLVLENMDSRKGWGRTSDELAAVFAELPDAGFCFDIAHAWSVDPNMSVAGDLLDAFGDRLRHVHLSSLSSELHHVPLTEGDEELFRPVLERCVDVPWILEAPPRTG